MTLAFDAPAYKGGRHILRCGKVAVGAIFPPPDGGKDWQWRCWYGCSGRPGSACCLVLGEP